MEKLYRAAAVIAFQAYGLSSCPKHQPSTDLQTPANDDSTSKSRWSARAAPPTMGNQVITLAKLNLTIRTRDTIRKERLEKFVTAFSVFLHSIGL